MPLSIPDTLTGNMMPLSLTGEMPAKDFGGKSGFEWYHDTFKGQSFPNKNPDFIVLRQNLARWMSDVHNIRGPYYIHDSESEGFAEQNYRTLLITILDPQDIRAFREAWGEYFEFSEQNARKNLLKDIERIDAGLEPEDPRLQEVYERFHQLDAFEFDPAQRVSILVNSYKLPVDMAVLKPSDPEV